MPGRPPKLTFALAALIVALLVAGCGGTENHTWQGEFTERLEGASAAVEERLPELQSSTSEIELFRAGMELGQTLGFKDNLIAELEPPAGCELVQQKGKAEVFGLASLGGGLFKNMTPELKRRLPRAFEEGVEKLEKFEHEAAHCQTD
jgi:hypothetical protein